MNKNRLRIVNAAVTAAPNGITDQEKWIKTTAAALRRAGLSSDQTTEQIYFILKQVPTYLTIHREVASVYRN